MYGPAVEPKRMCSHAIKLWKAAVLHRSFTCIGCSFCQGVIVSGKETICTWFIETLMAADLGICILNE